jgi:hypothetical protein
MGWEAANARARGLAGHLLGRAPLEEAARAGTWESAARALAGRGYPLGERDLLSRTDLDRAIGRIAARRLGVLSRWLGSQRASLAVVHALEDRRSLRRLLRGATQGASPELRVLGLTPTPTLPERLMHRLSLVPSASGLATLLTRAGHPAGRVLSASGQPPRTLWEWELALGRWFARFATGAARKAGRDVRRFTALCLDVENVWSLVAGREWGRHVAPVDVFLRGGEFLDLETFTALAADSPGEASWNALASCFASTPLVRVFRDRVPPADLERGVTMALVAWMRAEARKDPLSVWTVLAVALRIRSEAHDVRLVTFATDLGAPAASIVAGLETAA